MKRSFRDEIYRNKLISYLLLSLLLALILVVSWAISYSVDNIFAMALVSGIAIIIVIERYKNAEKHILNYFNAKPLHDEKIKGLVEGVSIAAGIPPPKVYVIDSEEINAFAVGKNPKNAIICLTKGAIKKLNYDELEGVIAHEISHIRNYDTRLMTIISIMIGILLIMRRLFVYRKKDDEKREKITIIGVILIGLSPLIAKLIQHAISRKREYLADAKAVELTRNPDGLIGALSKIKKEKIKENNYSYLFIHEPPSWLSTHPPIEDRIKRLREF